MTPHFGHNVWSQRLSIDSPVIPDESRFGNAWSEDDVLVEDLQERCSPFSPDGLIELTGDGLLYLPENYEPNYAYPLIVWLSGWEHGDRELLDFMPTLSTKNHLATTICGQAAGDRAALEVASGPLTDNLLELIEGRLCDRVREIRDEYHVHSERVYLAGIGHQGTRAIQLLQRHPEWYGGAIALGGRFPRLQQPPGGYHLLKGKQVLIGMRSRDRRFSMSKTVHAARLLHAAGMNVAVRVYDAADEVTAKMLSDMDHWIMDCVCESNLV